MDKVESGKDALIFLGLRPCSSRVM